MPVSASLHATVYDDLNRRTLRDAPGTAQDVSFGYDHFGRRLSASMGGDTVTFAFDALDRVTSETGSLGAVAYQYDAAGNNTRVTHPDGFYAQYDYNAGSELAHAFFDRVEAG
jgi:uncharacterized protein RhaS with RHS repeats